jgi:cyclophilin family peptidyl-prolyl cis-trans isomerase
MYFLGVPCTDLGTVLLTDLNTLVIPKCVRILQFLNQLQYNKGIIMRVIPKHKIHTNRYTGYQTHRDVHEHFSDEFLIGLKVRNDLKMGDLLIFNDWIKQAGQPHHEITDKKTAEKWREPVRTIKNIRLKLISKNIILFEKSIRNGKMNCEYYFGKKAVCQVKYFEDLFGADYMDCSSVLAKYSQKDIKNILFDSELEPEEKDDIIGLFDDCVAAYLKKRQAFRVVGS